MRPVGARMGRSWLGRLDLGGGRAPQDRKTSEVINPMHVSACRAPRCAQLGTGASFKWQGCKSLTRARRPARVRVTFACGAVMKRKDASSLRLARVCSTAVVLFQQGCGRSSAKAAKACGHSAEAPCKLHSSTLPSTSALVGPVNRVLDGFRSARGCTCEECSARSRHGFFSIALAGLAKVFARSRQARALCLPLMDGPPRALALPAQEVPVHHFVSAPLLWSVPAVGDVLACLACGPCSAEACVRICGVFLGR